MRKNKCILFFLALSLFLSGCGKEKSDGTPVISLKEMSMDEAYLCSTENLFEDFQSIYLAEPEGQGFYTYAATKDEPAEAELYYCNVSNGSVERLGYEPDEGHSVLSMSTAGDGALWLAEYVQTQRDGIPQEGYQINILSDNTVTPFTHEEITGSMPFELIAAVSAGKIYIRSIDNLDSSEYIFVYNTEGKRLTEVKRKNPIERIVYSEKYEKLYLLEKGQGRAIINVLDEDNVLVNEILKIEPVSRCVMFAGKDGGLNVVADSVLMSLDPETNELNPVFNLLSSGLSGYVRYLLPYGDEYLLIRRDTTSTVDTVAKLTEAQETQGSRINLKMAVFGVDSLIERP